MSLLSKTGLRSTLFALAAFAAVSALSASPALAGDRHHGGNFWLPPLPHIFIGLPPLVIEAGPPERDYYSDHDNYDRGYRRSGYGYRHGYGHRYGHDYRDDYREERRHHGRRHHRHHRHCGHDD